MNLWWHLGAYLLVAFIAGGVAFSIGYSYGRARGEEVVVRASADFRRQEARIREDLAARGLTGNLKVDTARRMNRAEARRWLDADESPSQAQGDPLLQKHEDAAGLDWAARILRKIIDEGETR